MCAARCILNQIHGSRHKPKVANETGDFSREHTHVKLRWAWCVPGWVTCWTCIMLCLFILGCTLNHPQKDKLFGPQQKKRGQNSQIPNMWKIKRNRGEDPNVGPHLLALELPSFQMYDSGQPVALQVGQYRIPVTFLAVQRSAQNVPGTM